MAISDALPGVEVSILVDGQPLQEYIDSEVDEEPETTTRYVESKTNQIFEVQITASQAVRFEGTCLGIHAWLDGKDVQARMIEPADLLDGPYTHLISGCEMPNNIIRKFRFDALETIMVDTLYQREAQSIRDLGELQVDFYHEMNRVRAPHTFRTPEELGIVPEKALKGLAISHAVGFADPEPMSDEDDDDDETICWEFDPVDPESGPAATFLFKYRSLASLKAEMIIPRTPSPPPLEEKEDLTIEEIRELQKQYREMKARTPKIKRERDDDDPPSAPKKKRNARSGPRAGDVLYTIDEAGARQTSTADLPARKQPVVIDLDSD